MADVELVIKVPKAYYELVIKKCKDPVLLNAFQNGTPLPEHHGRLIDADRLTRAEILHLWYHLPNGDIACPKIDIDHAPTIIEADRGER